MPKKKNQKTKEIEINNIGKFTPWIFTLFAFGALLGNLIVHSQKASPFTAENKIIRAEGNTYVSVKNLTEEFLVELNKGEQFAIYDGKTWIPVPGEPIEVLVLTDSTCETCGGTTEIASLRQNVSPALLARTVDISTDEGKELISKFEINALPKFFFGEGTEKFKAEDGSFFIDNLVKQNIVTQKDNLYFIDSSKVGFANKNFLSAPKIADIETEPTVGNGKIQVIEFSDFQCPYSKRLHDQNKDLIAQLIKENKIKYTFKDFPLGFHPEAKFAHSASSCVLKEGGTEKWLVMKDKIFETQSQWSGKGDSAKTHMQTLASDLGIDIVTCMDDENINAEIMEDFNEGGKIGVTGTPALFIGTQIMPGAITPDTFEKAVNKEL